MTGGAPESPVTFSWSATLQQLGLGIIAVAAGAAMLQADVALVWLLGVIVMLAGIGMIVALPFTRGVHAGPCPLCGARITVMTKQGRYLKCGKCLEYFEVADGKIRQMDLDHVAKEPTFEARLPWWDDLRAPTGATILIGDAKDYVGERIAEAILTRRIDDRTVSATWPAECCVCGSSATRHETLAQEVNVGPQGVGGVRDRRLVVRVAGIPHCDRHDHGVKLSASPGECGRVLFFRSYAYRNAFRRANPWKITWT